MGTLMHRFLLFFLLLPCFLNAQELKTILKEVEHISLSRQGNILVANKKGDVVMLDSNGTILQQFSPRKPARINLLEAWNGLRIFAFNRDFQSYFLLDRFLLSDGPVNLDQEKGYARLLAPAQDGNLWLLDEASFQVRKVNPANGNVLFSTPLDLILSGRSYEFSFMREYQNQLYLADKQGPMLLFDQNGTFRKKLPLENCSWFGFEGEELFTVQRGEIIRFHPFRLSLQKEPLPEGLKEASELVMLNGKYWALIKGELVLAGEDK
jgi:hypothetical protein